MSKRSELIQSGPPTNWKSCNWPKACRIKSRTGTPLAEIIPGAMRICAPKPPAFFFTDATYGTGAVSCAFRTTMIADSVSNRDEGLLHGRSA